MSWFGDKIEQAIKWEFRSRYTRHVFKRTFSYIHWPFSFWSLIYGLSGFWPSSIYNWSNGKQILMIMYIYIYNQYTSHANIDNHILEYEPFYEKIFYTQRKFHFNRPWNSALLPNKHYFFLWILYLEALTMAWNLSD